MILPEPLPILSPFMSGLQSPPPLVLSNVFFWPLSVGAPRFERPFETRRWRLAQRCEICGKGTLSGHNVSHAHNLSKRVWNPNLQRVRALRDGVVRTLWVCTRCLRTGRVAKAVRGRRRLPAA